MKESSAIKTLSVAGKNSLRAASSTPLGTPTGQNGMVFAQSRIWGGSSIEFTRGYISGWTTDVALELYIKYFFVKNIIKTLCGSNIFHAGETPEYTLFWCYL